jgi:hypothetical protein
MRSPRAAFLLIAATALLSAACAELPPPDVAVAVGLDVGYFYDQLSPYGEWVEDPGYGWVWSPSGIDAEWRPYTYGHWVYTDDNGWLWVADEEWGWAPYHYGRWFASGGRWLWVPGTEWAPAWCSWRTGGGYIGWAPLPPQAVFTGGVLIGIGEFDGYVQPGWYNFVNERRFTETRMATVILSRSQNVTVIKSTTNVTTYSTSGSQIVNRSVNVQTVERALGHPVIRSTIVASASTAGPHRAQVAGSQVRIFRPQIKAAEAGVKPLPPGGVRASGSSSKPVGETDAAKNQQREDLARKHAQEKTDLEKRHQAEIQKAHQEDSVRKVQARHETEHKQLEQKQAKERQQVERPPKPEPPPKKPHG